MRRATLALELVFAFGCGGNSVGSRTDAAQNDAGTIDVVSTIMDSGSEISVPDEATMTDVRNTRHAHDTLDAAEMDTNVPAVKNPYVYVSGYNATIRIFQLDMATTARS